MSDARNRPGHRRDEPVRTLTDARALAAMANPFRNRILDALAVDGASTASALAKRTGLAVGSASHHLKVLHEAGLIEPAPELARDRRERWWRLVSASTRWSRAEFAAADPSASAAAAEAEAVALQRQFERARDWLANDAAAVDAGEDEAGWSRSAFSNQSWLRLAPDELAELGEQLVALIRSWRLREIPDDGTEREDVFVFARAFPAQP